MYQTCDKDEKPWADQLAPELPQADSTPAPAPSQDALPAKPETASTEAPKPCPLPPSTQWPDAPGLPDDALPAKPEVILKAAPKPRPLPSEPQKPPPGPPPKAALNPPCDWPSQPSSGFHEPKPDLQHLGLAPDTPLYAWDGSWWMNFYDLPFGCPPTCATRIDKDHHAFRLTPAGNARAAVLS